MKNYKKFLMEDVDVPVESEVEVEEEEEIVKPSKVSNFKTYMEDQLQTTQAEERSVEAQREEEPLPMDPK